MAWIEYQDHASERVDFLLRTADTMLQRMVHQLEEGILPHLKARAPVGQHYSFSGALHRGGQLRDSLRWQEGTLGALLTGAEQGRFVISGTAPHTIVPRQAKALAFFWPRAGKGVVRRRVHHPGTQPNDFRQTGLQDAFNDQTIPHTIDRVLGGWISGEEV